MLVPSKFTRLEDATIFKMRCILSGKKNGESVIDVYSRTKDSFTDASEFLQALDVLFVLGFIKINDGSELVEYA